MYGKFFLAKDSFKGIIFCVWIQKDFEAFIIIIPSKLYTVNSSRLELETLFDTH